MNNIVESFTTTSEDGRPIESHYIYFNDCDLLNPLVNNYQQIKNEFLTRIDNEQTDAENSNIQIGKKANYITDAFTQPLYVGDFKSMPLMLRNILIDRHEAISMKWDDWNTVNGKQVRFWHERLDAMPTLDAWLSDKLDIIGGLIFNIAIPGSKLNHHYGLHPNYIRLHLTLKGAKGCFFDIENERHEWVDGELFGFDDCNVFHGTKHTGDEPRIVLLIDILKSAVKPYAKTWPCRMNIARSRRPKIIIASDW